MPLRRDAKCSAAQNFPRKCWRPYRAAYSSIPASTNAQGLRWDIFEGEPVHKLDRIHRVTDGITNLNALRNVFLVNERALFEWIVSRGSLQEAHDKNDPGHMQWLWDIADHSEVCLENDGPTVESEALALRLAEPRFGYLSKKDRRLLREAIILRCEAFLTVERRLPRNGRHIERELGIRVLTPITHWAMLEPCAALFL
jgi:hypothetical protein